MELTTSRGYGAGGKRLTAAARPEAPRALAARVDCRRAVRNILGGVEKGYIKKDKQLQGDAIE